MQAIQTGDLYFLRSPFHSTVSPLHEKKLAYLLGTVSSRPAVVIRAPYHWDTYGTVTVIPSLSNGSPSVTYRLKDRYGYLTEAMYNFMPHTPHSIPVSRLGRYIGHLSSKELEELIYAFKWIHDPIMQENLDEYPIPECYKKSFDMLTPDSRNYVMHGDEHDTNLTIDENLVIHAPADAKFTAKSLDGVTADIDLKNSVSPAILKVLDNDPDYHTSEETPVVKPVPTVQQTPSVATTPVPASKFPPSIFTEKELEEVAGRFEMDSRFYGDTPMKPRSVSVITEDEARSIAGSLVGFKYQAVLDNYRKFTAMDAYLLGPRLPTTVIARLLPVTMAEAACTKRLCCFLRDMEETEYQARLTAKAENAKSAQAAQQTQMNFEQEFKSRYAMYSNDTAKIELERIKYYLKQDKIGHIPEALQESFIRIHTYMIKHSYVGKAFQLNYTRAYAAYRGNLMRKMMSAKTIRK